MYCSQRRREIENIFSPTGLPPHVPAVRVPAVQFTFGHLDLQWSAAKCAAIQRVKGVARELRGTVHEKSLALVRLLPIMFRDVRKIHCRQSVASVLKNTADAVEIFDDVPFTRTVRDVHHIKRAVVFWVNSIRMCAKRG